MMPKWQKLQIENQCKEKKNKKGNPKKRISFFHAFLDKENKFVYTEHKIYL